MSFCVKFTINSLGFPGGSVVKSPSTNAGDIGDVHSIPGSGRSPGDGNGNPHDFGFSPEGQILVASIHPADGFCLCVSF